MHVKRNHLKKLYKLYKQDGNNHVTQSKDYLKMRNC